MKKILLLFVFFVSISSMKAQNAPGKEWPLQMEEMQKALENMMHSFGESFGDGSFFQMDTAFFKSFSFPFDGDTTPFEVDTTFARSFVFPFDNQTPFDSTFFRSFNFPFDGEQSPLNNEEWQNNMQEMMDGLFKNFMGSEWEKEWKQFEKEQSDPKSKGEGSKEPAKKRKKYIL